MFILSYESCLLKPIFKDSHKMTDRTTSISSCARQSLSNRTLAASCLKSKFRHKRSYFFSSSQNANQIAYYSKFAKGFEDYVILAAHPPTLNINTLEPIVCIIQLTKY